MNRTRLLGVLLLLGAASTAAAQNLVINGDFNTDTSSWGGLGPSSTFTWSALHGGSGFLVSAEGAGYNGGVKQSCFAVTVGVTYDFGGWIYVPSAQVAGGTVGIFTSFFSDAFCSASIGSSTAVAYVKTDGSSGALDTWLLRTAQAVAPPTAQRAWIYLNALHGPSAGSVSAYFDGIRFGVTPTVPVGLMSFSAE